MALLEDKLTKILEYKREKSIDFQKSRCGRKTADNLIKNSIEEGAKSLAEICVRTGLSFDTVLNYRRKNDIKLPICLKDQSEIFIVAPSLIKSKRRSNIDVLVQQGLTLEEIGNNRDLSKERIRQYIVETGQHAEWRKIREAKKVETSFKLKKGLLSDIRILIGKRLEHVAKEQGWPYQKAVDYLNYHKHPNKTKIPFDSLVELLKRYEKAVKSGNKISRVELGKSLDILAYSANVGRILKKIGLKPLYGFRERHITPKEKKEAIRRGLELKMPSTDIAYFLGLSGPVVYQSLKKYGKKNCYPLQYIIKQFGKQRTNHHAFLTYRLASQIYEAEDLRFNIDEITELLNTRKEIIDYAVENRQKIENQIVMELRILYKTGEINRPYITSKDKRLLN